MSGVMIIQNQLLATKFFLPVVSHPMISRHRLTNMLQKSLENPLTIVSASAGFGKTMLLSTWGQSLSPSDAKVAWVSLDEEDNEPLQFWLNAITALGMHQPERFTPLLKYLQSPQTPPIKYVLAALINLLLESTEQFVLILDDYHLITEQQIHSVLAYLVECLPPQLHIIISTRTDLPWSLSRLQAREHVLHIHTDQLCCTVEETQAFFQEVMHIQLPAKTIQEVTARTEGWLVGLQLLGLSLPGCSDPATLLEELSGDQRYILDFLTDEVLERQSPEVQNFLLSTCVLEHFTASLCDALMEQTGSQQMLEWLEQANLFIVSLDNQRQWYRYHALFAQALRYRLAHTRSDLVLTLHHRASQWYAQHDQATQAILHAFSAHQWQWAADLIERLPITSLTWGTGEHEKVLLRQWLEQLPAEIVYARPRLCLACAQILWTSVPPILSQAWLEKAEKILTASLTSHVPEDMPHALLSPHTQQEQANLLGEVFAWRALLQSFEQDGARILALCQQAHSLLSEKNALVRAYIAFPQMIAYYASTNNAVAAIESALDGGMLAQEAGYTALAIGLIGSAIIAMIATGQLREAYQQAQHAIQLGRQPGDFTLPDVGWPMVWQASILCEWNQLDVARTLAEEAIALCRQTQSTPALMYALSGYAVLAHICLSLGDLDAARSALQQVEQIGQSMCMPLYLHYRSFYTTVDQVRLWLGCGELDRARQWAHELDLVIQHGTPFAYEQDEVAQAHLLLATAQPEATLQHLGSALATATTGKRWKHVIEIRLLQARAYQMCYQEPQALWVLSEAVRLAEPEGYIRCFVDEGTSMAALLSQLRELQADAGPTPYLDTLLVAFPQQRKTRKRRSKQVKPSVA